MHAFVIGPAMADRVGHCLDQTGFDLALVVEGNNTADAAHV
jgi:hypothetical protein